MCLSYNISELEPLSASQYYCNFNRVYEHLHSILNLCSNYVDHHVSSREQITLQDTMEGVTYSTSKFGLDGMYYFNMRHGKDIFMAVSL